MKDGFAVKRQPVIVGHRGGFQPENTLLAFYQARLHGVKAVELDVWITADGQLAVIHGGNGGHIGHVQAHTDHQRFEDENYPLIFENTLDDARKLFAKLPEYQEAL